MKEEILLEVQGMFEKFLEEIKGLIKTLADDSVAINKRIDEITLTPGPAGEPGVMGLRGYTGIEGKPGKDAPPIDYDRIIRETVSLIPTPKDGKAGKPGAPGKDTVVDEEYLIKLIKKYAPKSSPLVRLGGGGGFNVEDSVEAVNGSRTTFTLFFPPKYLSIDGGVYFENFGYTVSGNTYTISFAPQSYVKGVR